MKSMKFLIMMLFAGSLFMVSCGDEEDKGTCSDGIKNQDETAIDCGGVCTACREGAQGTWKSFPVAPILTSFADSIIADFKANNTYTVDQWKGGAKVVLTGTYTQTKSGTGNIYNIVLNQSSPTALTAQGIFEVSSDDKSMKYEVAQVNPAIPSVTPPTATGGFGSTSGGIFGQNNVQNYVRK
ncbi:MAG: hypothetical protein IPN73_08255 [Saprospiraceae bacterium]|nr:hypothetical protein [Saprospiraceae bacterium]MBK8850135.1 hypothetical protein [Saprospiraceae bacterium]